MKKILSLLTLTALISGIPANGMFRGLTRAVAYSRMRPITMRQARPMSTTTQTPNRMKRFLTNPWVTVGSLFGLGGASAYTIRTLNNEINALESVNGTLTEKIKMQDELGLPVAPNNIFCNRDIVVARSLQKYFKGLGNTQAANEFAHIERNTFKRCTSPENKHIDFVGLEALSPRELYTKNIQSGKRLEEEMMTRARWNRDGKEIVKFCEAAERYKQATQELEQEMPRE